jgi:rhamnosyltransferase subunit B
MEKTTPEVATHFVLVCIGSAGDMYPFIRLGIELRRRGHDVTVYSADTFEPSITGAGLGFASLGAHENHVAALADPLLWHPRKGFGVVWRLTRPAMERFCQLIPSLPAHQPCVLVVHPLALPEADLCRAARPDLKIVAAYLAPANLKTVCDPMMLGPMAIPRWVPTGVRRWLWRRVSATMIDPVSVPGLNATRAARGLAPVSSLMDYMSGVADLSLMLFPAWFGKPQPDWPQPLRSGDFPMYDPNPETELVAELSAFLAAGTAPIVFTPGTGNLQAGHYFACALAAVERLGRRAIFLTRYREQLPPLPASVLWQEYAPLHALLPRVAALVHHGGIGTTAEALRAGVPQLVVPLAFDQFDNAARVEALGAGLSLRITRLGAGSLTGKLRALLAMNIGPEQVRAHGARFGGDQGVGAMCDAIEAVRL